MPRHDEVFEWSIFYRKSYGRDRMNDPAGLITLDVTSDVSGLMDPPPTVESIVDPPVPEYAPPEKASLKERTVRSSIWTLVGFGSSQVIRFGSNLLLTRLLVPDDFGVAAMVGMSVNMFQQFSDIGLGPAIIQNPRGDDARFLNTAWTLSVIRGFILWLAACAIAWPMAHYYHQPILLPLIMVTGFNGIINGCYSTSLFQLNRHMQVGKMTILNTTSQLITAVVMISIAFATKSVWAIIIGGIVSNLFTLVVSHFLIPGFRNRFDWDPTAVQELFRFGGWIFVSTAVTFFANEVDRLILGKIATMALLGLYQQATTLVRMPVELISRLSQVSLFPALSRSAELGPEELNRKLLRARGVILPLGIAAVIGLAFGAPLFVAVLYSQRFQETGWMAQFMAVGLWITILQSSADRALLALAHARPLALTNAVNMVATIIFAFVGHHFGSQFGPRGAVQGFILGVAVGNLGGHLVIQATLANRGISIRGQDLAYTLLLLGIATIGFVLPKLLVPVFHTQKIAPMELACGLLVTAVTCGWAGLRALKVMR